VLFLLAGLSEAVDGYLAKRFGWQTELGAYLDQIADKGLLVSIYVTLGLANQLPVWLVIAVVSRDILILSSIRSSLEENRSAILVPGGPETNLTHQPRTWLSWPLDGSNAPRSYVLS